MTVVGNTMQLTLNMTSAAFYGCMGMTVMGNTMKLTLDMTGTAYHAWRSI